MAKWEHLFPIGWSEQTTLANPAFSKEDISKSMELDSISSYLPIPILVSPGEDWPGEDCYRKPGSGVMLEEEGMEFGEAYPARSKRTHFNIKKSGILPGERILHPGWSLQTSDATSLPEPL